MQEGLVAVPSDVVLDEPLPDGVELSNTSVSGGSVAVVAVTFRPQGLTIVLNAFILDIRRTDHVAEALAILTGSDLPTYSSCSCP